MKIIGKKIKEKYRVRRKFVGEQNDLLIPFLKTLYFLNTLRMFKIIKQTLIYTK